MGHDYKTVDNIMKYNMTKIHIKRKFEGNAKKMTTPITLFTKGTQIKLSS